MNLIENPYKTPPPVQHETRLSTLRTLRRAPKKRAFSKQKHAVTASPPNIRISWSGQSNTVVVKTSFMMQIQYTDISSDGRYIAMGANTEQVSIIQVWDMAMKIKCIATWNHYGKIHFMRFSPHRCILNVCYSNEVRHYSLDSLDSFCLLPFEKMDYACYKNSELLVAYGDMFKCIDAATRVVKWQMKTPMIQNVIDSVFCHDSTFDQTDFISADNLHIIRWSITNYFPFQTIMNRENVIVKLALFDSFLFAIMNNNEIICYQKENDQWRKSHIVNSLYTQNPVLCVFSHQKNIKYSMYVAYTVSSRHLPHPCNEQPCTNSLIVADVQGNVLFRCCIYHHLLGLFYSPLSHALIGVGIDGTFIINYL